jgi:Telomere resolvase
VNQARELLDSHTWSEVAAGLAVVTGRRVSEILKTAQFSNKSTYSVMFTGAVKRRSESIPLTFEIPTLVTANIVIDAISKLRSWLDTSNMTNRQINERYEQAVAQVCDREFRNLVPLRSGKDNLYTHLFRAVYATIAAHWFCPPTVSDLEFRAYIQGHFQILNEASDSKRTSMAAQRHYWDYKIGDGQGNVDGRLGIKLQDPGVRVLSAFDRPPATAVKEAHGTRVHLRVFDDDRTALAQIQSQFDLPSRAAANHFVIELATSLLNTAQILDQTPQQLTAKLTDLAQRSLEEQTDLFAGRSEAIPLGLSPQLENQDSSVASEQNQTELTTPEEFVLPELAADNSTNNDQQLENQAPQTVNHQQALFERMEQQQQSMENLTRAIHGLVEVLAQTPSPSPSISVPKKADGRGLGRGLQALEMNSRVSPSAFPHERPVQEAVSPSQSQGQPKPSDAPVTKPTESVSKNPPSRKRRGELSRHKVNQYIDAIMAYNDVPDRQKTDKWLITIAALKRLTHCGQSVIYDVLSQREADIQFHHHKHQLGEFHNQKGRNAHKIESLISLT